MRVKALKDTVLKRMDGTEVSMAANDVETVADGVGVRVASGAVEEVAGGGDGAFYWRVRLGADGVAVSEATFEDVNSALVAGKPIIPVLDQNNILDHATTTGTFSVSTGNYGQPYYHARFVTSIAESKIDCCLVTMNTSGNATYESGALNAVLDVKVDFSAGKTTPNYPTIFNHCSNGGLAVIHHESHCYWLDSYVEPSSGSEGSIRFSSVSIVSANQVNFNWIAITSNGTLRNGGTHITIE